MLRLFSGIVKKNYYIFVTPVSCIFFATSSNSNMSELRQVTSRKCLLTFLSPSTPSRWSQLIVGGIFLLHLTTCTVVLLNFPLLSPNDMTCSFSLVILFFNALPSELQEAVQLGGYILPDFSTLLLCHYTG